MNFKRLLILAVVVGGGVYVTQTFELKGLTEGKFVPRQVASKPRTNSDGESDDFEAGAESRIPVAQRTVDTIRIGTFDVSILDAAKQDKPHVMSRIARMIREFDVVALQGIRAGEESLMPQLLELVRGDSRHFDYVMGPPIGPEGERERFAFVFDTASLQVDRNQLYTVADPGNLLRFDPLVGWFRVRGPDPLEAFTFTLIAAKVDPHNAAAEMRVMDDVYRAVRDDSRGEDDTILAGGFSGDEADMARLRAIPGMRGVIDSDTSNVRGTALTSNLMFQRHATVEYTGRSDVLDFVRVMNLSLEEALEISDHLPVWAEFRIQEGGRPSAQAASRAEPPR